MPKRAPRAASRPAFPTSARIHDLCQELLARPHVTGCFVGQKRTGGRYAGGLALVCTVTEKHPAGRLKAAHRLPGEVAWQHTSREKAPVATDVQLHGESGFQLPAVAGPGDQLAAVSFPNGRSSVIVATVGLAMRHPTLGVVMTTAGHAVQGGPGTVRYPPGQQPLVRLQNVAPDGSRADFSGLVLRSARIDVADYAVVLPVGGMPVRNLYHDTDTLTGLYVPQPADVGKPFSVLTARGRVKATLRGVFGVFTIEGFGMRDLILTDQVTEAGDSGCALVDGDDRVCGLLVGFTTVDGAPRSVFMSAFWALSLENAELF